MRTDSVLPVIAFIVAVQRSTTAYAFSSSSTGSIMTSGFRPFGDRNPFSKGSRPKFDLSSVSTFLGSDGEHTTQQQSILREFEKKEKVMQKRREEAQAKLEKYEESLQMLQSKKAEYLAASQVAAPPAGGTFSETTLRSAVKSFTWRVVAGSVTFVTSLRFSGSVSVALKVVGADFFSKAFTMFLGERLMNKSQAGRKAGSDDVGRSFAKALIWRLFAIANTLTMAVFVSKDLSVASKIASTDAVFKTMLMFFYERIWARIEWGKEYLLEFAI